MNLGANQEIQDVAEDRQTYKNLTSALFTILTRKDQTN